MKTDHIYNGSIINVEKQTVELPNGQTATRDIVKHAKAVGALALTSNHKMIMETQWRAPIASTTLEIPAGKVDPRDSDSSDPSKHAMIRELNEETRYKAKKIEHLTGFYSTVGFSNEYMDLYLVTGLEPVSNELPRDKGEYLEIKEYSLDEALSLLHSGKIVDGKTIMAILYWQLMQNKG